MKWQPLVSAILNGSAAICLLLGYILIRQQKRSAHQKAMLTALFLSTLFLVNYLVYHSLHGSQKYQGTGTWRTIYFTILISHTILATLIVPFIGFTLRWAFTKQFPKHKRIARYTLAMWIYVSITGVLIYLMLYVF